MTAAADRLDEALDDDKGRGWQQAVDSDGAAQAVCRAIAQHVAHGGSIPWPSIAKPYREWAELQEAARCEVERPCENAPLCPLPRDHRGQCAR